MSDQPPLLKLRFTGARFSNHTFPIALNEDIKAFERCVFEIAEHLYKERNGKTRLPHNFHKDWSLEIASIEQGSTGISLVVAALMNALPLGESHLHEEAISICMATISASEQGLPTPVDFPNACFDHFGMGLGKGLLQDEAMEVSLPRTATQRARLTPQIREELIARQAKRTTEKRTLTGFIDALDIKQGWFRINDINGKSIGKIPYGKGLTMEMVKNIMNRRDAIEFESSVVCDSAERIIAVHAPNAYRVLKNYALVVAIEKTASIEAGWLEDGHGAGFKLEDWAWLTEFIGDDYPDDLPLPIVAPTPDGNMILEWNNERFVTSLEIYKESKMVELVALEKATFATTQAQFDGGRPAWAGIFEKVYPLIT